ncbi:MAG: hypothetical protein ACP5QG_02435 [candidate division WOR-3 bacterium]
MAIMLALLLANPGPPHAEKIGFSVIGGGSISSALSETLCFCRNDKELITSPYVILAVPNHKLMQVHVRFVRCSQ